MECRGGWTNTKELIGTTPRNGGSFATSSTNNGGNNSRRRHGRKQKSASEHDVSSNDFFGISTWPSLIVMVCRISRLEIDIRNCVVWDFCTMLFQKAWRFIITL